MNYSYVTTSTGDNYQPTIDINKRIRARQRIILASSAAFMLLEYVLMALLFFGLYMQRTSYEFQRKIDFLSLGTPRFYEYLFFFISFSLIYAALAYRHKLYFFRSRSGFLDEFSQVARVITYTTIFTVGIIYLFNFDEISRLVVLVFWATSIVGAGILRWVKRRVYFVLAKKGIMSKNVVILGAGKVGQSLISELCEHTWLGYSVTGYLDDNVKEPIHGVHHLGGLTDLKHTLKDIDIDEVIITIPSQRELVQNLISDIRKLDLSIKIVPDMFNLVTSSVQIGSINALPVVTLVKTPMRGLGLLFKRLIDIVGSGLLILLCLPFFAITALAIKINSKGPVIYRQARLGKNGKAFKMLKFRSMHERADDLLEQLEQKNEVAGIAFKMKNDPRVTKVGRFIRKYSIDELPQLFNVLKGDMSLVGPRPPLPYEVEKYGDWEWRRLEVLPGITGLWQVSGRSDLSFQQWMRLDIYYIENWSIGLDIKIMLKTIPCVLKGEGAY